MTKKPHSILLIEDSDSLREVLATVLESYGYIVAAFSQCGASFKSAKEQKYDLILSDFKLPGISGLELLAAVRETDRNVPFLLMTAYGSVEIAVEAMKLGANDFISKPFEPLTLCKVVAELIEHRQRLNRSLGKEVRRDRSIITNDPKMKELMHQAKVARVDSTVLILGDSGTGKELMARYIHENSLRSEETYVSVNCAALPPELLESEFFGHEAGSFTGATQLRKGLFEVAANGTIFLDEVGEMPPDLQVKLLRALQEREIKRVGGTRSIKISPRVIAATNVDPKTAITNGALREDFYYRIAVITFDMPALKERKADIELLTDFFIKSFSEQNNQPAPIITKEARQMLNSYHWPGNIRELENIIERAIVMSTDQIGPEHLGLSIPLDFNALEEASATLPQIAQSAMREAETEAILKVLSITSGNKTKAARRLGVSYKTLLNKISEYQIR